MARWKVRYGLLVVGALLALTLIYPLTGSAQKRESRSMQVPSKSTNPSPGNSNEDSPFVVVLGVAQDAGFPQAGCKKDCCSAVWKDPSKWRSATSLAIVDPKTKQRWLVECTPNFPKQWHQLETIFPVKSSPGIDGIFLTHAHIGHYAGLMHLGREVIGAKSIPVFCMPRMGNFLRTNGPWSQLVKLKNIQIVDLKRKKKVKLNSRISITPILVPHRGEFSETVGYRIDGPKKSIFFLPDIDKWQYWSTDIESIVKEVDVALLDGTFYDGKEIPNRDMSEIPHPFISRSIQRFSKLPEDQRSKIHFIHFNHSNPVLNSSSPQYAKVKKSGFQISEEGQKINF